MSFKIVVDSCCDLTPAMLKNPWYVKVPLTIFSDGQTFTDDENFNQADLLAAMKRSEKGTSTACPSPQSYLDAYQGADDIYVVTLSAMLSGSHNSAEQARKLLEEDSSTAKVHVFNSCSAVSGEVLVARQIEELARAGVPFEEVVSRVERYIYEMQTFFVLESLENLRKNGRLTRLQAIITGALRIKLFMGATPEGEICKMGQALTVKQALTKMVDHIAADPKHRGKTVGICHVNNPERARQVRTMIESKCRFGEILMLEGGGVTTCYAEDGGIVVAY